jgi:parallel beta-helix repeat protein
LGKGVELLRKAASIIMLSLLVVSALVLAHNVQPVKSDYVWTQTIYIQADGNIQPPTAPISSVDNVTYTLTDNIAGNVTGGYFAIITERDNITIDGAGHTLQGTTASNSRGIELTGRSNVTIKNMKIMAFGFGIWLESSSSNNSVSGNNITNDNFGIYLGYNNNNSVSGNNITKNGYGIWLYSSSNNTVSGNNITANNTGTAIVLDFANNNSISGNNITNNGGGISLYSSSNNRVSENNMTNNSYGIALEYSSNSNSISGNNINANGAMGIDLVSCSDNTIYHNNLNNTSQVYLSNSTNVWDNGYPSGGNYWSDYNGTDKKSGSNQTLSGYDGIGDTPYIIDSNNTDHYPLMQPLTGQGVLLVQTSTGSNVTVSPTANVSITFASVTAGGFTSWNMVQPPTNQFVSVTCNELRTSASYTGNVTLKFAYDPSGLSLQDQQAMKIWLWNDSSSSCWIDVTTSINTSSHTVYGVSPHLSVFGITRDLDFTSDLDVQGTTVTIPTSPPPSPPNLSVLEYCQINTTKNLGTSINLGIAYYPGNIQPGQEIFTQMWLWNESSASWVDITSSVNTTTHTVYGISPHLSVFGITNLQSAPTGITVTSVNFPKTVVCQGYNATIGFTVTNQGGTTQQNFNVLLYCNATLLATFPIARLDQHSQIALSCNWSTAAWVKGNYSVNTCSSSIRWIVVSMVGDLTGAPGHSVWDFVPDKYVDGSDLIVVARCFGSWPGAPPPMRWNANCDINNDGSVDGSDLIIVARHFGQTSP